MKIDAPHQAFRFLDAPAFGRYVLGHLSPDRTRHDCSPRRGRSGLLSACIVALMLSPACVAQQTNLDRLNSCSQRLSDSLLAAYHSGDTLCVSVAEHPAAWVLDQAALGSAAARGLHVTSCEGARRAQIALAITELGVDYREIDDPDSLQRSVHMACSAALTSYQGEGSAAIRTARRIETWLQDTIATAQMTAIEAPGYDYTKGTRAAQSASGFWSRVVEPAVVLGAAAVMVILLFTVRSQ